MLVLLVAALPRAAAPLAAQDVPARVVRQLAFVGNRAIDDYTLSSAIATTKSSGAATYPIIRLLGFGEKRYFDELEFRRDVVRLILHYRQSGYMRAVVDTVVERRRRDVFITFRIHEGEPVRVARLEIEGIARILDAAEVRRALPLQVGDPFDRALLQASADTVIGRLRGAGYPYADVLRNFDAEAGGEALRADVRLEALPGPRMRIGEVLIRGLDGIDTPTVRRSLPIDEGALFSQERLFQAQRELYGLGVFRLASVVLADSVPPSDPGDTLVRVLVQVQEGPRRRVRFGAGYGSVECFRTQSGWAAHDFLGAARVLDVSARLSKLGGGAAARTDGLNQLCNPFAGRWTFDTMNYTLAVSLRQPTFLTRAHTAALGVFAERRSEFQVYTRDAVGGNAEVTMNARRAVPVTIGYAYSVGRTEAQPGIFCSVFRVCDDSSRAFLENRRTFGAVALNVMRDRVNNTLDPSRGSLVTAAVLHASRGVGSQAPYEFNRAEIEVSRYYPIGRRTVFAWHARAGTILPKGITLAGQQVGYVPPDQRFYAGGPNSVRGYGRNELGPRVYIVVDTSLATGVDTVLPSGKVFHRVQTAPTGGNSVVVVSAELRFPSPVFAQRMRLGAFVDVGQVWERGGELVSVHGIRVTPGVGVRVATPLGPVRIDVAYNGYPAERGPLLYQQPDSIVRIRDEYPPAGARGTRLVWQFAVGHAF